MKRDARTTRRGDRAALGLLGALLIAGAVITLLLATGAISQATSYLNSDQALLNPRLDRSIDDHQLWWQLGTLAAGLLLASAGLLWLRHQLPAGRRLHDTRLDVHDDTPGHTVVDGHALANALEADVRSHPDVLDARADMILDEGIVRLRLTAADDTNVQRLVHDAVNPAITRLATVAGLAAQPAAHIDVRLRHRQTRPLQ
jgi:hypothetical protein